MCSAASPHTAEHSARCSKGKRKCLIDVPPPPQINTAAHAHLHTWAQSHTSTYTLMHTRTHAYTLTHVCACTYGHMCVHTHSCMHTYVPTGAHTCIQACAHTCAHTRVHIVCTLPGQKQSIPYCSLSLARRGQEHPGRATCSQPGQLVRPGPRTDFAAQALCLLCFLITAVRGQAGLMDMLTGLMHVCSEQNEILNKLTNYRRD